MTIGGGYAEAEHDGQFGGYTLSLFNGDACVLDVEDRLNQQSIYTAIAQSLYLFSVCFAQHFLVEWLATGCNAGGSAGRADAACYEAWAVRRTEFVGTLAGQTGCCEVDVAAMLLQTIVAHGDTLGIEGVGLNDISTSSKVLAVNITDNEGGGQRQHVVAALEVVAVVGEPTPTECIFV